MTGPADDVEARKTWARRFIAVDRNAPAYGTAEWLNLPDGPSKVAAVVRAAECWVTDLEETLARIELDRKAAEDAAYVARRDAHRATWVVRRHAGRAVVGLAPAAAKQLAREIARDVALDWERSTQARWQLLIAEGLLRAALVGGDPAVIEEAAAGVEQADRLIRALAEVAA